MMRIRKLNAIFLISLVLSMFLSFPLASAQSTYNTAQSCIEKNKETNFITETMENDIIKTLESLVTVLHAVNSIWQSQLVVIDLLIASNYNNLWGSAFAASLEEYRNIVEEPLAGSPGKVLNYMLTCSLPAGVPSLCNVKPEIFGQNVGVSGSESIYTAIGCLCLPQILKHMKKLNTVYKTYNCCVEQACINGMSTVSCEEELDVSMCMYLGVGGLFSAVANMALDLGFSLLYTEFVTEWIEELPPYFGTLFSLGNVYFKIEGLLGAWETIQTAFDEPNCEDLGFKELNEESGRGSSENCNYVEVDLNGDGIYDRLDYVCT
ncbi:hypothetical protein ISS07_02115 [Candidatus Woesearchaeota archaeon]|nr:hypothetical protein [Candidatus Woesearchaeota archaeon]